MCLGTTGVITAIRDDDGIPMALVDAGQQGEISACLLTCPDACAGDIVLVHSGYVLQIKEEDELYENPRRPGPRAGRRNHQRLFRVRQLIRSSRLG